MKLLEALDSCLAARPFTPSPAPRRSLQLLLTPEQRREYYNLRVRLGAKAARAAMGLPETRKLPDEAVRRR